MYWLIKYDPQKSPAKEFGCDTYEDIETLPNTTIDGVAPGSTCLVLEDSSVFMLGGHDNQEPL